MSARICLATIEGESATERSWQDGHRSVEAICRTRSSIVLGGAGPRAATTPSAAPLATKAAQAGSHLDAFGGETRDRVIAVVIGCRRSRYPFGSRVNGDDLHAWNGRSGRIGNVSVHGQPALLHRCNCE